MGIYWALEREVMRANCLVMLKAESTVNLTEYMLVSTTVWDISWEGGWGFGSEWGMETEQG